MARCAGKADVDTKLQREDSCYVRTVDTIYLRERAGNNLWKKRQVGRLLELDKCLVRLIDFFGQYRFY